MLVMEFYFIKLTFGLGSLCFGLRNAFPDSYSLNIFSIQYVEKYEKRKIHSILRYVHFFDPLFSSDALWGFRFVNAFDAYYRCISGMKAL